MRYVEREEVRYVRLHDDGKLNVADIDHLSVEGILPAPGDFCTQIDDDGFYYTIQIVERHRVFEPSRNDSYWCLIFRDVDDSRHLDHLAALMLEFTRNAGDRRKPNHD